jgi:hypothetical protein
VLLVLTLTMSVVQLVCGGLAWMIMAIALVLAL